MHNNNLKFGSWIALLFFAIFLLATDIPAMIPPMESENLLENQPEELGRVNWLRDLEEARRQSAKENKPILILFQEVPGCATCRRYGNYTLSHPLIVEAIETAFIPLAIFNNKGGEDRKVLNYFNEPTWNNPVVRIVNADKMDIVPRLGGNYTPYGLVNSMLLALDASNKVAPRYLQLLGQELQAEIQGTEQATLSMYCFWTGEKELGKIPGIVATEAGFMGGREVVQVEYNPAIVSYEKLIQQAEKASCASHVFTENAAQEKSAEKILNQNAVSKKSSYRPDKEPKYYLSKTHWKYVPMTKLQAVKANSLVGQRKSPTTVLSPRQIELAKYILSNKNLKWENLIGVELENGWEMVEKIKS